MNIKKILKTKIEFWKCSMKMNQDLDGTGGKNLKLIWARITIDPFPIS